MPTISIFYHAYINLSRSVFLLLIVILEASIAYKKKFSKISICLERLEKLELVLRYEVAQGAPFHFQLTYIYF